MLRKLSKRFPYLRAQMEQSNSPAGVCLHILGGHINGSVPCDFDFRGHGYPFGVHDELYQFLTKHGWLPEWYDRDTLLAFPTGD